MATTTQKRTELKKLSKAVKTSIYDMLRLADELLSDHEYVEECGGEQSLIDALEADEFSHFGGKPSLPTLLRAYRHSPSRSTWAKYHYNVVALIELAAPAKEGQPTAQVNWKAKSQELEAKLARLESTLDQYQSANADLEKKCEQLIAENGELRGQLKATERFAAATSR